MSARKLLGLPHQILVLAFQIFSEVLRLVLAYIIHKTFL
jgi:hypothetical protein